MNREFKENELVIYVPKDSEGKIYKFQIGKFKRYNLDFTCGFVYYHAGSTASATDVRDLYHLEGKEYLKDEFNSLD